MQHRALAREPRAFSGLRPSVTRAPGSSSTQALACGSAPAAVSAP
ncbi:hypothetical protein WJ968_09020 [Achromobacter xylosoxidans]